MEHESTVMLAEAQPGAQRMPAWGWLVLAAALSLLLLVAFQQGVLLHLLETKLGGAGTYFHEFFHDGNHLFGTPCH